MWIYEQVSGRMYRDDDPDVVYVGYSGFHEGKNNPALQYEKGLGPIPVGFYDIGAPYDSTSKGPYVMRLEPKPETDTRGRTAFLIHGDSIKEPGTASHGCIIQSRVARTAIWESRDHLLRVIDGTTERV